MYENAVKVPGLTGVMARTSGSPEVHIGLIDGMIETSHETLHNSHIVQMDIHNSSSREAKSARQHATFLASMLVGSAGLGFCPGCTLVSIPVVDDGLLERFPPQAAAQRLAAAVFRALESNVDVIQISLEFAPEKSICFDSLREAIFQAAARGIRVVMAAGNRGLVGASSLLNSPGIIPVAMAGADRKIDPRSTRSLSVGSRGLLAPGVDVVGAELPHGIGYRWGTSFAAAFVTGTFALLRSIYPEMTSNTLWEALLRPDARVQGSALVPPFLDPRVDTILNKRRWLQ